MPIEVGVEAPDFVLKDQNNQEVRLSDFRGRKNVLLVFYPLAFSGVCSGELCSLRDELPTFQNDQVQVLTISVDSVFTHKAWAMAENFDFPLLSDFWPHGEVANAYGIFDERRGTALRGTYLIDTEGILRWRTVNDARTPRNQGDYLAAIKTLDT